jgi:hypothetical protein
MTRLVAGRVLSTLSSHGPLFPGDKQVGQNLKMVQSLWPTIYWVIVDGRRGLAFPDLRDAVELCVFNETVGIVSTVVNSRGRTVFDPRGPSNDN